MSLYKIVNAMGNAVSQHYFAGKMEGVAVAKYELTTPNVNGTHSVIAFEMHGDDVRIHQIAISDYEKASEAYNALVKEFHSKS